MEKSRYFWQTGAMRIFQGFILILIGFLILVFRPKIKDFIGNISFAERYLGMGGTWTFLVILGVLFVISGLMWMSGSIQNFFMDNLGTLFYAPR